jgi:hypothetical protein
MNQGLRSENSGIEFPNREPPVQAVRQYYCADLLDLAPVNENAKVPRLGFRLRMWLLFRWSGCRAKIRGAQIKLVRFWINLDGFRPEFRLDCPSLTEFVGRIFMENMNHALFCGHEEHARFGLKRVGIHSGRNRKRLNEFAGVSVKHRGDLRTAT